MPDIELPKDIRNDLIAYLEIARVALRDDEFGEPQKEELDLSDWELDRLILNLEVFMNTDSK